MSQKNVSNIVRFGSVRVVVIQPKTNGNCAQRRSITFHSVAICVRLVPFGSVLFRAVFFSHTRAVSVQEGRRPLPGCLSGLPVSSTRRRNFAIRWRVACSPSSERASTMARGQRPFVMGGAMRFRYSENGVLSGLLIERLFCGEICTENELN